MGMKISRDAYEHLISEDIRWLKGSIEPSLERDHITAVLEDSVDRIYGKTCQEKYERLRELAWDMYSRMKDLSHDLRPLREAMDAFYNYINFEEDK